MKQAAAPDNDPTTSRVLAFLYAWGRLIIAVMILAGLVMSGAGYGSASAGILGAGLSALTLLPAIGLLLLGTRWLQTRFLDPIAWLALVGAAFLIGAWFLI